MIDFMTIKGRKHLALAALDEELQEERKVIEYYFRDTEIAESTYIVDTRKRKRPQIKRKAREEAVIVEVDGASYDDLLEKVKDKVDSGKKIRKEELLVTTKNGDGAVEKLSKEIKEVEGAVVRRKTNQKVVLHIRDLDAVTQKKRNSRRIQGRNKNRYL